MVDVKSGIPQEAKENPWLQNNIIPNAVDARYFEDTSGLTVVVFKVRDQKRDEEHLFVAKITHGGYMKSRMKLRPGDAKALVSAIRELLGE